MEHQTHVFTRFVDSVVHATDFSAASERALAVANHLADEPAELLVVGTEGRDGAARWSRIP